MTSSVISMPAAPQGIRLLRRHAAHAGDHVVFGREVLAEHGPGAGPLPDAEIANHWTTVHNREPEPQLVVAVAAPRDRQQVVAQEMPSARSRLELRQVAAKRLGSGPG